MTFKTFITQKVGVDKAILYTLLSRGLQISTALFTIFFIAKNLSVEEQGFYYTFGSITALQVFFELGMTYIVTQFVAHDVSHLKFDENYKLIGDKIYRSRLSSLLRFCTKWYLIFAGVILISLFVGGVLFFGRYSAEHQGVEWLLPWLLLAIGTALNFLAAPILSFIEGLGKVKEVAKVRFIQQILHPVIVWGGLSIGSKLYVSGADAIIRILVVFIIIFKSPFFKILKNIWGDAGEEKVSYMGEIFPLQWKIAVSWISGYFIFQIFNPVLFAVEGPKVAGQMGMTLAALNGIQALAQSWINTKVPRMSGFIAQKDYKSLDLLFNKTFKQMVAIGTMALVCFVVVIYTIQSTNFTFLGMDIGNRFIPIIPLLLISAALWTLLPISAWAVYLRCHKQEPMLIYQIFAGISCGVSAIVFGKLYGLYGMVIGFAVIRIVSIIWVYKIFTTKKKEWHNEGFI